MEKSISLADFQRLVLIKFKIMKKLTDVTCFEFKGKTVKIQIFEYLTVSFESNLKTLKL